MSSSVAPEQNTDLSSMISQVAALEAQNRQLQEQLKHHNEENHTLKEKMEKHTAVLREKMKTELDTMMNEWLGKIDMTDEKVKEEFLQGMQNIVKQTKEDSGVWQVMCCASRAHIQNVNKLNEISEKYNELQKRFDGGNFRTTESRIEEVGSKRPRDDGNGVGTGPRNIWEDFELSCRGGSVSNYVPDPSVIQSLRSEWKPLT